MKSYKDTVNNINSNEIRFLSDEELKNLKKIMFECYQDVYRVCEKHNLSIMLGGGSALGAVRHNGYIPWDDDFDALMPRKDFEKLKIIFEREFGDKYILISPNYRGSSINRFPKVLINGTRFVEVGANPKSEYNKIKIDIFILENVPNNIIVRYLKGAWGTFLMYICSRVERFEDTESCFSKTDIATSMKFRRFIGRLFSFKNASEWRNIVDKACQYKKETNYLGIPTGRKHYFGEILPRSCYLPVSQGIFEGQAVSLPGDYDKYLSNLYGDYMKLPPIEKREKHSIVDIAFSEE